MHWKRPWCWERLKAGGEGDSQDEMVGWHHQLNWHEFEQTPGDSEGQGSLACCSSCDCKESDRIEQLNNSKYKKKDNSWIKTLLELHTSAKHYILFAYTHCLYNVTKGFEIMAFIFSLFYFIFPHGFIVFFFFSWLSVEFWILKRFYQKLFKGVFRNNPFMHLPLSCI